MNARHSSSDMASFPIAALSPRRRPAGHRTHRARDTDEAGPARAWGRSARPLGHDEQLEQAVVLRVDGPEGRVGDAPRGEADGDRPVHLEPGAVALRLEVDG